MTSCKGVRVTVQSECYVLPAVQNRIFYFAYPVTYSSFTIAHSQLDLCTTGESTGRGMQELAQGQ